MNLAKIKKNVKHRLPEILVCSSAVIVGAGTYLYYRNIAKSLRGQAPQGIWLHMDGEDLKNIFEEDVPVTFTSQLGRFVVSVK